MDLVFFGIQGSGKGTQAKRLAEEFGYYIFEAGGELRKIAASGSELGATVKSYIDAGHLVPFEIIMQVVSEAIATVPEDQEILFDGIPRDHDQMVSFDTIMHERGREFRCVNFLLGEDEAFNRILGRAQKEGRADDADEESIRRRMGLFHEKTAPVIEKYADEGKMTEVDAGQSVDQVYENLKENLSL